MLKINCILFIVHKGKYCFQKEWMKLTCKNFNIDEPIFIDKTLNMTTLTMLRNAGYTDILDVNIKDIQYEDNLEWINVFMQIDDYLTNVELKSQNVLVLSSHVYLYRDFPQRINELLSSPIEYDLVNLCTDNIFGPYLWSGNRGLRIFKSIKTTEMNKNENRYAWLTNCNGIKLILKYWKMDIELLHEYHLFYTIQNHYNKMRIYSIPKYLICYPKS